MRNIVIEPLKRKPIQEHRVEMVEYKGLGHPDTICDAVCEAASRELSKYYLKKYDNILHHNLDKGLLVAGKSQPKCKGGQIIDPIHIIISGRATDRIGEEEIPVNEIVIKAAKDWIKNNLRLNLDHIRIDTEIKPGSCDLQEVFKRSGGVHLSNDTSFGVGFAPLSDVENLVLETGKLINSKDFVKKFPAVGDDIKVMGLKNNNKIKLTIAIAFIDKHIKSVKDYFVIKEKIKEFLLKNSQKLTKIPVEIEINTLDDVNTERDCDIYLTVTGTSAEVGDDGQVGRGNRVNSLITPNRTMSLEAAAGKNPTNHVGKIYNVLSNLIAKDIIKKFNFVKEVDVQLLSSIGKPIDQPQVANIEILTEDNHLSEDRIEEIRKLVDLWLSRIGEISNKIINEEVTLF